MKINFIISLLLIAGYSSAQSQEAVKAIQAGNDFYKQEQFNEAAIEYNKAVKADPSNNTAKFNKGNAVYKQDQKVDAAKLYAEVAILRRLRDHGFFHEELDGPAFGAQRPGADLARPATRARRRASRHPVGIAGEPGRPADGRGTSPARATAPGRPAFRVESISCV